MDPLVIIYILAAALLLYIIFLVLLLKLAFDYKSNLNRTKKYLCKLSDIEYIDNRDVVFQTLNLNCGSACFEMILQKKNIKDYSHSIRELDRLKGSLFKDIIDAGNNLNISSKVYKINNEMSLMQKIKSNSGLILVLISWRYFFSKKNILLAPLYYFALIFWGRKQMEQIHHWVVIAEIDESKKLTLYDPYLGRIKMPMEKFKENWNSYALIFY